MYKPVLAPAGRRCIRCVFARERRCDIQDFLPDVPTFAVAVCVRQLRKQGIHGNDVLKYCWAKAGHSTLED